MVSDLALLLWNLVWGLVNLYNFYPLFRSRFAGVRDWYDPSWFQALPPQEVPTITVIVPAYREEVTLRNCVESLRSCAYPPEKLEVLVATEADDPETGWLAHQLSRELEGVKHIVVANTTQPRGKPRALNYALKQARGDIIGVIDAEDVVDRRLFQMVVYYIKERKADAVQGVLDMANDHDGWLNMQFRAEYAFWFRRFLPSLVRTGFAVPLGGTTNFFRRQVLEEMGGWDPYNVTEDFELGLRLFSQERRLEVAGPVTHRHFRTVTISAVTREESPRALTSWLRQRTRWQRGKLQTLRKVLTQPPRGLRKQFHLLMAASSVHIATFNMLGIALSLTHGFGHFHGPLPLKLLWAFNMAAVGGYMGLQAAGYLEATRGERVRARGARALLCSLSLPGYWCLQWLADLRALKQEFIDRRVFWEKTAHEGRHLVGAREITPQLPAAPKAEAQLVLPAPQAVEPSPPRDWVKLGTQLAQVLFPGEEAQGHLPPGAQEVQPVPSGVQEALAQARELLKSFPGGEAGVLSPRLGWALQGILDGQLGLEEAARQGEEACLALLSYLVREAPLPLLELQPRCPELKRLWSWPALSGWVQEGMASPDPEARQRYVAIAGWGGGLCPLLLRALEDPHPPVRALATRLLASSLATPST